MADKGRWARCQRRQAGQAACTDRKGEWVVGAGALDATDAADKQQGRWKGREQ